jgi:hypothetical protein
MNPARCWAHRFSYVFEKSDHVVICPLFDLQDFRNSEPRSLPNFGSVLLWNLAKIRHRLAGKHFNFQPNLKLALVRPDFAHLWQGITINHLSKIKAGGLAEKRFSATTKGSDRQAVGAIAKEQVADCSANSGTHETPVVLQTNPAAGEKVSNRCNRFFRVLGAGTYCEDQIPKRKPRAGPEDLAILFHGVRAFISSNSNAIGRCEYFIHAQRVQLFISYAL